jgi:GNAT superfamily N-acetyltransferase
MHQGIPTIRLSRPADFDDIINMDLKCYEYPMSTETWREYINKSGRAGEAKIVILEIDRKSVGFAFWQDLPAREAPPRSESTELMIAKLGILPGFRRQGLGEMLLTKAEGEASFNGLGRVYLWVPHHNCHPGDSDDVSVFLNHCGYLATGECMEGPYIMYGDKFDLYKFKKEL